MRGRLVGPGDNIEIPAENFAPDGTNWTLDLPAELTAGVQTGKYTLQVIAGDGATEKPAGRQRIVAFAADAADLRTQNERILDALINTFEGRASKSELSMSGPNGRAISRMTNDELQTAIKKQERRVKSDQDRAEGKARIQTQHIRFNK